MLAATLDLLAEEGHAADHHDRSAAGRGGYPGALPALVVAHGAGGERGVPRLPDLVLDPTGDLRRRGALRRRAPRGVRRPPRAAMPGLISDYQDDPGVHRRHR
ncbi:MAG: hypothetical protein U0W40_14690 [Acidimicrobiia bacterium]